MSNQIYDRARFLFLTGQIDWRATDIVVTAWSGTASFVPTETTIGNIIGRGYTARGTSLPVTGMSAASDGTAQTDAVVLPTVPPGAPITWFTLARFNLVPPSSELLLYLDDMEGQLPYSPNGLDIVLTPDWSQGRGWFRL